ncbi:mitochondrial 50S ribosomal protein L5 [Ceratobasidium sp. AG-I]|nr:mitochondrial 50S ribosomal protein L5 [Ceratobasidium sp. AG-I]
MSGLRSLLSASSSARICLRRVASRPISSGARSKSTSTDAVVPPTNIILGDTHIPRCQSHFENTLAEDLLYLTYNHASTVSPPAPNVPPQWDMTNPYAKNRPPPAPRGNRPLQATGLPTTPENLPRLERVILHTMIKDAITSKAQLLGPIMAFRAISGQTEGGGGRNHDGVRVLTSRPASAAFRLREGVPVSLKVELRGPQMYEFVNTLVEFVLPRLREFRGFAMPAASSSSSSPSAMGGVIAFGLPREAFALFPQLEVNLDSYPRMCGMHVQFVTNLKGKDAQGRARALVSGFQIPFVRK